MVGYLKPIFLEVQNHKMAMNTKPQASPNKPLSGLNVMGVFNSPNNVNLQVSQHNLSSSANITIEGLKDSTLEGIKNNTNNSAKLISDSKTTINGNVIYEINYTEKNLGFFLFIIPFVDEYKSLLVITGKDRQVYVMHFHAQTSTFDKNREIIDKIVGTIKIQ